MSLCGFRKNGLHVYFKTGKLFQRKGKKCIFRFLEDECRVQRIFIEDHVITAYLDSDFLVSRNYEYVIFSSNLILVI